MLAGQLSTNTVAYCYWLIDADSELIELSSSEEKEGESEEEKEENKKEKDDEIRSGFTSNNGNSSLTIFLSYHSKEYLATHHPENITPPPQVN